MCEVAEQLCQLPDICHFHFSMGILPLFQNGLIKPIFKALLHLATMTLLCVAQAKDTLILKQALALLLTVNRIPQLYYGTEVLMNGTKEVTDGNVRKDFPGGFPGDTHNAFTADGRTRAENAMFTWLSRLLHWRQGNDVVVKGTQKQFIPYNGVYVIARLYGGKTVMTVVNGTRKASKLAVKRYAEVIGSKTTATDVLTGNAVSLSSDVQLEPRQALILEF